MAQKKHKYAVRRNKATPLGYTLQDLRKSYESQGNPKILVIPYVLTCAAFLEARLNDALQESEDKYGPELAEAFQSISLPKKLQCVVSVLTGGAFEINRENLVYQ